MRSYLLLPKKQLLELKLCAFAIKQTFNVKQIISINFINN